MLNIEKTIFDLIEPIISEKDQLTVKVNEDNRGDYRAVIRVDVSDIARLIGKQGSTANVIRETLLIASRIENKRISVKFETNEDV